jgi:hypothetical protein
MGIKAMPIHNTGFKTLQKIDDWIPRSGLQNVTHDIDYRLSAILFAAPALKQRLLTSVADPDPNLDPDPRVFGPPGSGSGSFYHHAKIVRKTIFLLFCDSF